MLFSWVLLSLEWSRIGFVSSRFFFYLSIMFRYSGQTLRGLMQKIGLVIFFFFFGHLASLLVDRSFDTFYVSNCN